MAEERSVSRHSAESVRTAEVEDAGIGNPTSIVRGTVNELERILDTRHVVGEPMNFGETTVIPLVSMGFGFGAGGGGGRQGRNGDMGQGGGGGGGGGIKPVAVLVVDANGVRLAPIPEPPSGLDKLGGALASALEQRSAGRKDSDSKG